MADSFPSISAEQLTNSVHIAAAGRLGDLDNSGDAWISRNADAEVPAKAEQSSLKLLESLSTSFPSDLSPGLRKLSELSLQVEGSPLTSSLPNLKETSRKRHAQNAKTKNRPAHKYGKRKNVSASDNSQAKITKLSYPNLDTKELDKSFAGLDTERSEESKLHLHPDSANFRRDDNNSALILDNSYSITEQVAKNLNPLDVAETKVKDASISPSRPASLPVKHSTNTQSEGRFQTASNLSQKSKSVNPDQCLPGVGYESKPPQLLPLPVAVVRTFGNQTVKDKPNKTVERQACNSFVTILNGSNILPLIGKDKNSKGLTAVAKNLPLLLPKLPALGCNLLTSPPNYQESLPNPLSPSSGLVPMTRQSKTNPAPVNIETNLNKNHLIQCRSNISQIASSISNQQIITSLSPSKHLPSNYYLPIFTNESKSKNPILDVSLSPKENPSSQYPSNVSSFSGKSNAMNQQSFQAALSSKPVQLAALDLQKKSQDSVQPVCALPRAETGSVCQSSSSLTFVTLATKTSPTSRCSTSVKKNEIFQNKLQNVSKDQSLNRDKLNLVKEKVNSVTSDLIPDKHDNSLIASQQDPNLQPNPHAKVVSVKELKFSNASDQLRQIVTKFAHRSASTKSTASSAVSPNSVLPLTMLDNSVLPSTVSSKPISASPELPRAVLTIVSSPSVSSNSSQTCQDSEPPRDSCTEPIEAFPSQSQKLTLSHPGISRSASNQAFVNIHISSSIAKEKVVISTKRCEEQPIKSSLSKKMVVTKCPTSTAKVSSNTNTAPDPVLNNCNRKALITGSGSSVNPTSLLSSPAKKLSLSQAGIRHLQELLRKKGVSQGYFVIASPRYKSRLSTDLPTAVEDSCKLSEGKRYECEEALSKNLTTTPEIDKELKEQGTPSSSLVNHCADNVSDDESVASSTSQATSVALVIETEDEATFDQSSDSNINEKSKRVEKSFDNVATSPGSPKSEAKDLCVNLQSPFPLSELVQRQYSLADLTGFRSQPNDATPIQNFYKDLRSSNDSFALPNYPSSKFQCSTPGNICSDNPEDLSLPSLERNSVHTPNSKAKSKIINKSDMVNHNPKSPLSVSSNQEQTFNPPMTPNTMLINLLNRVPTPLLTNPHDLLTAPLPSDTMSEPYQHDQHTDSVDREVSQCSNLVSNSGKLIEPSNTGKLIESIRTGKLIESVSNFSAPVKIVDSDYSNQQQARNVPICSKSIQSAEINGEKQNTAQNCSHMPQEDTNVSNAVCNSCHVPLTVTVDLDAPKKDRNVLESSKAEFSSSSLRTNDIVHHQQSEYPTNPEILPNCDLSQPYDFSNTSNTALYSQSHGETRQFAMCDSSFAIPSNSQSHQHLDNNSSHNSFNISQSNFLPINSIPSQQTSNCSAPTALKTYGDPVNHLYNPQSCTDIIGQSYNSTNTANVAENSYSQENCSLIPHQSYRNENNSDIPGANFNSTHCNLTEQSYDPDNNSNMVGTSYDMDNSSNINRSTYNPDNTSDRNIPNISYNHENGAKLIEPMHPGYMLSEMVDHPSYGIQDLSKSSLPFLNAESQQDPSQMPEPSSQFYGLHNSTDHYTQQTRQEQAIGYSFNGEHPNTQPYNATLPRGAVHPDTAGMFSGQEAPYLGNQFTGQFYTGSGLGPGSVSFGQQCAIGSEAPVIHSPSHLPCNIPYSASQPEYEFSQSDGSEKQPVLPSASFSPPSVADQATMPESSEMYNGAFNSLSVYEMYVKGGQIDPKESSADLLSGNFCVECNTMYRNQCKFHSSEYTYVSDSPILSHARLTLPASLKLDISSVAGHSNNTGVFAKDQIAARTKFGPLIGSSVSCDKLGSTRCFSLWQTFVGTNIKVVDTSDENSSNWLMFVKPARVSSEQNLIAFQHGYSVFFVTRQDIEPGTELRFWFSKDYARMLGLTNRSRSNLHQLCPHCTLCNTVFADRQQVRSHMRLQHRKPSTNKCSHCSRQFSKLSHLKAHVNAIHLKVKKFVCITCGKRFTDSSNLRKHVKSHSDSRKMYPCRLCGKDFSQKAHLVIHMNTHMPVKHEQCGICGQRFSRAFSRRQHEAQHIKSNSIKCEHCDKTFYKQRVYKEHLKIHLNQRNFLCSDCGRAFRTRNKLKRHCPSCKQRKRGSLAPAFIHLPQPSQTSQTAEDNFFL